MDTTPTTGEPVEPVEVEPAEAEPTEPETVETAVGTGVVGVEASVTVTESPTLAALVSDVADDVPAEPEPVEESDDDEDDEADNDEESDEDVLESLSDADFEALYVQVFGATEADFAALTGPEDESDETAEAEETEPTAEDLAASQCTGLHLGDLDWGTAFLSTRVEDNLIYTEIVAQVTDQPDTWACLAMAPVDVWMLTEEQAAALAPKPALVS